MFIDLKTLRFTFGYDSFSKHLIDGIIIRRGWWVYPFVFIGVNFFLIYLNLSGEKQIPDNIGLFISAHFVLFFFLALIMAALEYPIMKNYEASDKEIKLKKLKKVLFIGNTEYLFSILAVINILEFINFHEDINHFIRFLLVYIVVSIFFGAIFTYFFWKSKSNQRAKEELTR